MTRIFAIKQLMFVAFCTVVLIAGTAPAHAARAHVHGEGELSIAIEDGQVDLSLIAPAADLMSDGDESEAEMQTRYAAGNLFAFQGASCQLVSSAVVLADEEISWSEPEEHDHDGQEPHEAHADHEEHADHEAHDDHDEEDHSGHSDYLLTWTYQCSKDPSRLTSRLFEATNLESIRVQAIGESGVITEELTKNMALQLP